MTLEPNSENPNDIRTKLAQNVQVVHKKNALPSNWSDPYASSNAEYNILRRKFFIRGDTEHALNLKLRSKLGWSSSYLPLLHNSVAGVQLPSTKEVLKYLHP